MRSKVSIPRSFASFYPFQTDNIAYFFQWPPNVYIGIVSYDSVVELSIKLFRAFVGHDEIFQYQIPMSKMHRYQYFILVLIIEIKAFPLP
jgi:hypothetical protein